MRSHRDINMKKFLIDLPKDVKVQYFGNIATFEVAPTELVRIVSELRGKNFPLAMIDATDERATEKCFKIWYVFSAPADNMFVVPYIRLEKTEQFPSVSAIAPAMSWCERKIKDMFGLTATGNSDQRQLLLHENWPKDLHPLRKDFATDTHPKKATGKYNFAKVDGEGIYEIPVGPIHAGIIEPGHFRFSMAGETIVLLEARLGYVHKGHEKLFESLPLPQKICLAEKISGDASFSHSLAFCQAAEQLADLAVPERATYLRTIYAELERLACHIGDIGFMMLDTGFNFGGANGQRLREIIMRINQRLTGSRFLRGVNAIGGVTKDISKTDQTKLAKELKSWLRDANEVIAIAENSATFMNRVKNTGPLGSVVAHDYGAVGVAARAVGIITDARIEHPYAAYAKIPPQQIACETSGDAYARFCVRVKEVQTSVEIITKALKIMPAGETQSAKKIKLQPNSVAIGCVESWRGEILHFVATDERGEIARVAVRDPSCINWQLVGYSGQGQIVPDFPLINKSYNLSYTGNDL